MPQLRYESIVEAPLAEVFSWHDRPGALQRLQPPWEFVTARSVAPANTAAPYGQSSSPLAVGTHVEFRPTLPIKLPTELARPLWIAEHTHYDPPHEFRDVMCRGPFRSWTHRHRFEAVPAGTVVGDEVDFALPLGRVGDLAERAVQARLDRMFAYRHRQLAGDLVLHAHAAARGVGRLRVAIAGSSGLIGTALTALLRTGGHEVLTLVRRPVRHAQEIYWDPEHGILDPDALIGVDAVINLAGAPLAGRWSVERKLAVLTSRVCGTTVLSRTLATLAARGSSGPPALINASAIGYYGADEGPRLLTEDSAPGDGFLADVVREWEAATEAARRAGLRVVHIRTGVVQSPIGGALRAQLPLFLLGAGGRFGNGGQWLSWIGLDDAIGIFHHALTTPTLHGPINAVAPAPVSNREYTATLARVLRRPALLPLPTSALKLALGGEAARELLLASQRAVSLRVTESGYVFRHPTLDGALRHVLGRCG